MKAQSYGVCLFLVSGSNKSFLLLASGVSVHGELAVNLEIIPSEDIGVSLKGNYLKVRT